MEAKERLCARLSSKGGKLDPSLAQYDGHGQPHARTDSWMSASARQCLSRAGAKLFKRTAVHRSTSVLVSTIHLLSLVLFMFLAHMRAIIAAELPPGCLSGALMLQGGLWGLAQRTIPANKALTISSIPYTPTWVEFAYTHNGACRCNSGFIKRPLLYTDRNCPLRYSTPPISEHQRATEPPRGWFYG